MNNIRLVLHNQSYNSNKLPELVVKSMLKDRSTLERILIKQAIVASYGQNSIKK